MSLSKEQFRLQRQLLEQNKAYKRRYKRMPASVATAWTKLLGFMRENYAMDEVWEGEALTFVLNGVPFCEINITPERIIFSLHGEEMLPVNSVDEVIAAIAAKRQPNRVLPSEHFTISPGGGRCDLCLFNRDTVQRRDRRVEMTLGFAKCYGTDVDFTTHVCNGDHSGSGKPCTIHDIGSFTPGLTADEVTHILFPYWYTKSSHMSIQRMEDAFNAFFADDTLKNALDFAAFLRANGMIYDGEHEIHCKGKLACYIDTPNDKCHEWRIWTVGDYSSEYEGVPMEERVKEIAWANVVKCGNCDGVDCDPGKTEVIFGKEFANVCNGADGLAMRFTNPDAEALECIKRLLEMRKHTITKGD